MMKKAIYDLSSGDVRKLFHQLSRAKEELALVVKGNETVYTVLLNLLQGRK